MDFSTFTTQQLQQARGYAAQVQLDGLQGMIEDAPRPLGQGYIDGQKQYAVAITNGKHDHCFTIRQRMYYFLTGDDVALLP